MMIEDSQSNFHLTSEVVTPTPDGNYPVHITTFLIPHEALRRELDRGLKALDNYDPIAAPWKAYCMNDWFRLFIIPLIHDHHDNEEKIAFPFYHFLGADMPVKQSDDHHTLIHQMEQVRDLSHEIWNLVKLGGDNHNTISHKLTEFKQGYKDWHAAMMAHFAEEETYWPPIIEKYGVEKAKEMEDKIVSHGIKEGGEVFENFGACIAASMGILISKKFPFLPEDKPWCGDQIRNDFLSKMPPFPVRKMLMKKWNRRYQRFKTMIVSVAGQVDILNLQETHPDHADCNCVIA